MPPTTHRRSLLGIAAGSALGLTAAAQEKRPRVAAIVTEFTYRSHAHVILENFLEPYYFNGKKTDPGVDIVALYADQAPEGHLTDEVAREYRLQVFKSIEETLCVGGRELAVDAVLSIGEHGRYPRNGIGQIEYPRKRFFDAIVAVFKKSGRTVPVFNDKHLSYRWDWAKEMVETARTMGFPLMAGSSVPLAQRLPPVEFPSGARVSEAVSIHGGGVESYDFHAFEVLQSLVELRRGGETGITQVEFLSGPALLQAGREGRWSIPLAEAAMAREPGGAGLLARPPAADDPPPHGILLTYADGLRAAVLKFGRSSTRWNFACRLEGRADPLSTHFYVGPWQNRNLFKALSHAIQHHFRARSAPYPVERTLLASGVLDAAMHSRAAGRALATPHLRFNYSPRDFTAMREMGESWKIVTEQTPQPRGIDRTAR